MNFVSKINTIYKLFLKTGLWGVLTYKALPEPLASIVSKLGFPTKKQSYYIDVKDYEHPVLFRYGSSDSQVLYQSLVRQEYSCIEPLKDPKLILDCGANVGYTSIYFLNKYPNAHVIAVEPDDENYNLCIKNLLPYKERVTLIKSAIWSHKVGLTVCKGLNMESLEWAAEVRECREGEKPELYATDILNLLKDSGFEDIDILKMDIEKAESVVFSENYAKWLPKVKNIVIELHNNECEKTFFKAMDEYKYELKKLGELTICKNIVPQY